MTPDDLDPFVRFMDRHSLEYLEVRKGDFHLVLRRTGTPGAAVEEVRAREVQASAAPPPAEQDERLVQIVSPLVGTFYRAPSPGSPPFVEEGSRVTPNDTLCIVEAMKVMNEIKAECAGVVRRILVENGTPVEYGQALFVIERA